ncbi:HPr kinase/phosphorylase [bacterium BMS3Bbin10]|nr:HPr kinase/phosphorylase [bacterium BMS3Bbin10]
MSGGATSGELLVHGTCIAMSASGALLRGAPGSGKSDLALRFISLFGVADGGIQGACLVADDQVLLSREGRGLVARSPETIAGRLEVRGVGIVEVPHCERTPLTLVVDLVAAGDVPRMPPDPLPREDILGVQTPVVKLNPFEISSPVKLKLVLTGRP